MCVGGLVGKEHARFRDSPSADHCDHAWDDGQEERNPPSPLLDRSLSKDRFDSEGDGLGREETQVHSDGDERDASADHAVGAYLGKVCSDGDDFTSGRQSLNESENNQQGQAKVREPLAARASCRKASLSTSADEHPDNGDVDCHTSAELVSDGSEDDSTEGPGQEGHTEADPYPDGAAAEEVSLERHGKMAVDGVLVPLDDVSEQQRPVDRQEVDKIGCGLATHGCKGAKMP
mmetsp:Transcript_79136/g.173521  ORF Transcript_79136/g.173521 Transcript_79136/m.173521 type:complete len:233 (+) Transcript_79136:409-1107(+)